MDRGPCLSYLEVRLTLRMFNESVYSLKDSISRNVGRIGGSYYQINERLLCTGELKTPSLKTRPLIPGQGIEGGACAEFGCARPNKRRRRGFDVACGPRPPDPAHPLSRGRAGCEVSEAGACAVARSARGGGFITTS